MQKKLRRCLTLSYLLGLKWVWIMAMHKLVLLSSPRKLICNISVFFLWESDTFCAGSTSCRGLWEKYNWNTTKLYSSKWFVILLVHCYLCVFLKALLREKTNVLIFDQNAKCDMCSFHGNNISDTIIAFFSLNLNIWKHLFNVRNTTSTSSIKLSPNPTPREHLGPNPDSGGLHLCHSQ